MSHPKRDETALMVRHPGSDEPENDETSTPGKGPLGKVADYLRELLTDPPHEPGQPPVGWGPLGLEWK